MNSFLLKTPNPKHLRALNLLESHLSLACKSVNTIKSYKSSISKVIKEFDRLPEECTKSELIGFLVNQKTSRGIKYATIKNYVYAIKYYLVHIAENVELSLKIPCPKIKTYDIEVLSITNLKTLIASCTDSRQRLIVKILYETGMRLSELANLKLENIDFDFRSITIINSKNKKSRTIKFGEDLEAAIHDYLIDFPSLFSGTLLCNKFHPFISLSRRGIYWNLKHIAKRAGIYKKVSPHILRHTFAVHYLNFGGSIFQLQNILGHRNMITTLNYLQYAILPESKNISALDALALI